MTGKYVPHRSPMVVCAHSVWVTFLDLRPPQAFDHEGVPGTKAICIVDRWRKRAIREIIAFV
jgi:hypothetical protein